LITGTTRQKQPALYFNSFIDEITVNTTYQYRETENTTTAVSAKPMTFIRFDHKLYLKSVIPWTPGFIANSNTTKYNQLLINTYFKIKPFKLQDLEIGYKEKFKILTDLIDKEIAANNYYFNYNMGTNFNFGWFTQYFYTSQTDNNTRNLLFTSFYYNFMSNPF
jgi:hypothetical protein